MPALREIPAIRAILNIDRAWSAYALGDLAPGFFEHSAWFQPQADPGALVLIYSAFTPPVLFAQGAPESLGTVLDEFCIAPRIYLHVRPEMLPVLTTRFRIVELRPMWRMILEPVARRIASSADAVRVS